jgi:DNA-binding PadR family transcriptional regulator
MKPTQLSQTEYVVLGLLAEGPSHGFAIAKHLEAEGPVGQILTVRQPLVYRALGRLVEAGLAEPVSVEPGDAGPQRVIHRITSRGRRHLMSWLTQPVEHVRDLRIEFLLKLVLLHRSGTSPLPLVEEQRAALHETLTALENPAAESTDPVELWRKHNAAAAAAYLAHLESLYRQT